MDAPTVYELPAPLDGCAAPFAPQPVPSNRAAAIPRKRGRPRMAAVPQPIAPVPPTGSMRIYPMHVKSAGKCRLRADDGDSGTMQPEIQTAGAPVPFSTPASPLPDVPSRGTDTKLRFTCSYA